MSTDKKTLYLLDAYALIYRAYYAFIRSPRVNSAGLNTSAMFGFTNALTDIINNHKPTHIAVGFDMPGKTFRNDDYPAYKANREETPEDIRLSIPYIRQIIEGFNIPILEMAGYEADDVIGTIAKEAEKEGFEVFMVTPDKDFAQLVTENIKMVRPARSGNSSEVWGVPEVLEKFGVKRTDQVIDMLGLWGDASDNIPGIPGIGEKTAKKLLGEYDTVEGLIENADKLKGKQKENVINFAEQGLLSKRLATIVLDVPIDFNADELILEEPNKDMLRELFSALEFRTISERILGEKITAGSVAAGDQMDLFGDASQGEAVSGTETMVDFNPDSVKYQIIETKDKRNTFIRELMKQKSVCFDTETTSIDANSAELVGIAFSWKEGEAYYIPLPENENGTKFILKDLLPFFKNENILKIGHNLKYDITVLAWYDIRVHGNMFDTMLAHYLIQPDMGHSMDELSETYLSYRPIPIERLIGKRGKSQKSMRDIPVAEAAPYACEDADITYRLYEKFNAEINKEPGIKKVFYEIEMPLMPVLARMEACGVHIDTEALMEISKNLEEEALVLETDIYELAGTKFNLASPKQLGIVLFEEMKISAKPKKTKTGQYSTNEETLLKYSEHEIVGKILEFRQIMKLKSTYVDALPALINPRDNRIHTTYMQAVASTGRLSSQNPNLQNIPIRTERGRAVRKAFIPSSDSRVILAADYSQIELRLMAEMSQDKAMLDAFESGEDIHAATAAKVFGLKDISEVTRDMRDKAKMVNFGIIYGISAFGLGQRLGISRTEASELIENYFKLYPGVKAYMDGSIELARENGYVETLLKRRRYLSDINSRNATVRGFAERNAINAPIQGSAADMIKLAMIKVDAIFRKKEIKSDMILQVHDELVFDAEKSELDTICVIIEREMREAMPELNVPIKVDMDTGGSWLEAH